MTRLLSIERENREGISLGFLSDGVLALGLFVLALLPRVLTLAQFITSDEPLWVTRSINFLGGVLTADWQATLQTGHPGVTTMWTGSLGLVLDYALNHRDAGTLLAFIQSLPDNYRSIDPSVLPWMRLPTGLLAALSVVAVYLLLRSVDRNVAVISALLLAFDQLYLAHSRVLHHDALVSVFIGLSVLAALSVLRHWSWKRLVFSGVMGGLAFLSKSSAYALVPFVGGIILAEVVAHRLAWRQAVLGGLLWGLAALATIVLIWPAIWVAPGVVWQAVFGWVVESADVEDVTQTVLLHWDNRVPDLGILFYPINWLLKTTPLSLLGLLFLPAWWHREPKGNEARWWVIRLLAWVALFGVMLTLGDKRDGRYLLPTYFAFSILAAFGLKAIYQLLSKIFPLVLRFGRSSIDLYNVIFVVLLLGVSLPYHPYYLAYYNPLIGGRWLAPRLVKVGWGEGMERAAAWLNAQPDADKLVVATSYEQNFLPFFSGQAVKHHDDVPSDYVLNYVRQVQNGYPYPEYWEYYRVRPPVYKLKIAGIDYLWLNEGTSLARVHDIGFGDELELMGYAYDHHVSTQGEQLIITLVWRATMSVENDVRLQLRDDTERIWAESKPAPVLDPNGPSAVEGHYILVLPADIPRGDYQLWVAVGSDNKWLLIGAVPVYRFAPPEVVSHPLDADFGDIIVLRGFDTSQHTPSAGETMTLTLYWQALQSPPHSYTTFVHVLDAAGNLVAQSDVLPGGGQWPTDTWKAGEWVTDEVLLSLPSTLPAGEYRLLVGWYVWETGERLPLRGEEAGDALTLIELSINGP
jgi:hypothetical protein